MRFFPPQWCAAVFPLLVAPLTANSQLPSPAASVADAQIIGTWQGSRIGTEFLPNHTFKRDGLYRQGMNWQIEGRMLTQWNPEVADADITPTTPLPGAVLFKIVSITRDKLILENGDGRRFIQYRLLKNTEAERESAAGRAITDTARENKRSDAIATSPASSPIPSALQRLVNSTAILGSMEIDTSKIPPFLIGDFDGDGKQDYAVSVKPRSAGNTDLAILFAGGQVRLASSESSIGHNYPGPDWKLIPKRRHIRSRPEFNNGHSAPTLIGDAISLERPESSAAVLYWRDRHLRLYWVSD